jgi:23S rRNA (uracil1939-C5)-methyltransferase
VVLVSQAIPGERVRARVERAGKGVAFAETVEVVEASPDRRDGGDWRCGGNVLSHVGYPRQLTLKGEIVLDAFGRIGRVRLPDAPAVMPSREDGYRMRARLHARGARLGFYREGTHDLCDAGPTRQLLDATSAWVRGVEQQLAVHGSSGVRGLELSEDISGEQRAAFLDVDGGSSPGWFTDFAGPPAVVDTLTLAGSPPVRLQRSARSFFQGNRYLVERMAGHVASLVPEGPVLDLYAGVGLFGLVIGADGREVTLVEGDRASAVDLTANAAGMGNNVHVFGMSVEVFLRSSKPAAPNVIVDPPRTGLSNEALTGLLRHAPRRLVYVSCDPATLARDARALLDAGYELGPVTGIDLFPNTAHIETVAVFDRS